MSKRDEMAEKYQAEDFKNNPDGYTVAPYCNSETLATAYASGWDAALEHDERVLALVEALKQVEILMSGVTTVAPQTDALILKLVCHNLANWSKNEA